MFRFREQEENHSRKPFGGTVLSVLDEKRTFGPKKFYLILWGATFLIILAILFGSGVELWSFPFVLWIMFALISFRQIWMIRWFDLDQKGISSRNMFGWRKRLEWEKITSGVDEEISMRKQNPFRLLKLISESDGEKKTMVIDSDTQEFKTLHEIVMSILPQSLFLDEE